MSPIGEIPAGRTVGRTRPKRKKQRKIRPNTVDSSSGRKLCSVMSGGWDISVRICLMCRVCVGVCAYSLRALFFFFPQGPKEPPIGVLGERKENKRMCVRTRMCVRCACVRRYGRWAMCRSQHSGPAEITDRLCPARTIPTVFVPVITAIS